MLPWFKKNNKSQKETKKKKIPNLKQIRYLGQILSQKERKIVKILFSLIVFCLIILLINIYLLNSEIVPKEKGTYSEGLVGQPKSINPLLSVDEIDLSLTNLIYAGLLKYNENRELIPDLVKKFSPEPGQKEYSFCLKENLFWHDKKELTIDDILFTFNLAKNPVFKNPVLEKIKQSDFEKLNQFCLRIKLKESSYDLSFLTLGILPKHVWENIPLDEFSQSEFNLKPIGNGPFLFDSLARDQEGKIKFYQLRANPNYHLAGPFLEKINFSFYSNFEQALEALKNKQINGLIASAQQIGKNIIEKNKFKSYQLNFPYYTAIFFNLRILEGTHNVLLEKSVRQALAHLTPKIQIFKEIFNNQGVIINSPILPYSIFFNPEIKDYEYNPELAKNILSQTGWKKNTSGFYEKNNEILEISLTTIDQPEFKQVASLIQKSWQDIGIKVKLIIMPAEKIKEVIKNRDFQAFLYGILENFNSDPFPLWHSSQSQPPGLNLTGFYYRRSDELLEKASLTNKIEEKIDYYKEFQEIVANNLPAIFLYNTNYSYLIDPKIKGVEVSKITHPSDRFNNIENWYLETKRKLK